MVMVDEEMVDGQSFFELETQFCLADESETLDALGVGDVVDFDAFELVANEEEVFEDFDCDDAVPSMEVCLGHDGLT